MGEVIYQASAKNSRQGELLIQDTLALDINNKDIVVLGVFLGCLQRVLSLKLENFPLNVTGFLLATVVSTATQIKELVVFLLCIQNSCSLKYFLLFYHGSAF